MVYVKSLVAGVAVLFGTWILFAIVVVLRASPFRFRHRCISYDPRDLINHYWFVSTPVAVISHNGPSTGTR
jgi:hypothetical protein